MRRTGLVTQDGVAAGGLLAAAAFLLHPILRCLGGCFTDLQRLHGDVLGSFALPDSRLNAWILAWDQHALLHAPGRLFDTNCFHPASLGLTGSEHLLGVALSVLPLRLLGSSPVLLHQGAVALSFVLLGLTTFAFVRWLTGSAWPGFVAGVVAMAMPWRIFEVSHVQLVSLQWFPLIWLLAGRLFVAEGRRGEAALLAALLALQLLSSFYLAYFLALSTLVLIAVVRLQRPPAQGAWKRLAAAAALPAGLLVAVSVPYLRAEWSGALAAGPSPEFRTGLGGAWSMIAPELRLLARPAREAGITYSLPLLPALLAAAALLAPAGRAAPPRAHRARVFALGLGAAALAAFILMLGRVLEVGEYTVLLPSYWAAQIVPGFEKLRAPFRWGAVVGVICPILAGVGLWRLESGLGLGTAGRTLRWPVRAGVAALLALNVPLRPLPAAPAWPEGDPVLEAHRGLAELPPGPVLELPWPIEPAPGSLSLPSRYALGSTLHWRPMLDGYTGHLPRASVLLRRVARRLPDPHALETLKKLTRLRWIVLHEEWLAASESERWRRAAGGRLRAARHPDGSTRILEVPAWEKGGEWMPALAGSESRPRTLSGLPRTPLPVSAEMGRLRVGSTGAFRFMAGELGRWALAEPVPVDIANRSDRAWPGLDVQREGLVELRARFRSADGSAAHVESFPIDADVPAGGSVATTVFVRGPTEAGRYHLSLDLVQRLGNRLRELGVAATQRDVEVRRLDAPRLTRSD